MRQYQKRKKLHMLIAILMSLNIFSVGYATWAITGPTTRTADGGFSSYPVIKSDEYVSLESMDILFINFYNYNNGYSLQGCFANLKDGELTDIKDPTLPDQSTTVTLNYSVKEALKNMIIETELVFGTAKDDTTNSNLFFSVLTVDAAAETATVKWEKKSDGVYLLRISNVQANATDIKVTISMQTTQAFASDLFGDEPTGSSYRFYADTVVKGSLQ